MAERVNAYAMAENRRDRRVEAGRCGVIRHVMEIPTILTGLL